MKKIIIAICGSSIFLISFILIIIISSFMILNLFGVKLTKEKILDNAEYATAYQNALNKYLKDGYVPLQRLLYFYLEDDSYSLETLYLMNQDSINKTAKDIYEVCEDERVKNMSACNKNNLKENEEYLVVSTGLFNFPLESFNHSVTSFFHKQRVVYNKSNIHGGWDFSASAKTKVYSVCDGVVTKVNFTQNENIPYDKSGNSVGNSITIKCDKDYEDIYYVIFHHLYPQSSKVKVGQRVNHWTEIAGVGTTGHSTGNHLHYEVHNSNGDKIDGLHLINFNLTKS